jgi:outer membrane protein OmpA-like peptidoglycan-associated protein
MKKPLSAAFFLSILQEFNLFISTILSFKKDRLVYSYLYPSMKRIAFLLFSIIYFTTWAQTNLPKKVEKIYQKAIKEINANRYPEAIVLLEQVHASNPEHLNSLLSLADLYFQTGKDSMALISYEKIKNFQISTYYKAYLNSGILKMRKSDYAGAQIDFQKLLTFKNLSYQAHQDGKMYLADCIFSIDALKRPFVIQLKNLGDQINTPYYENRGWLDATGQWLYFTRRGVNDEDIFISRKNSDGNFEMAEPVSLEINTTSNEGGSSVSGNGKLLFFTACDRADSRGSCDIYVSEKMPNNRFGNPKNLDPIINSPWWESQPSISSDGKKMYFLSNRPGGYGGWDIWKSIHLPAGWSTPENLGPTINTRYDEASPFVHPDGQTLYFASAGHPGFGAKDLFVSHLTDSGWTKPLNMGSPINNAMDQSGIWISTDGKSGILTSDDAPSLGKTDLFSFEVPEPFRPWPTQWNRFQFVDAQTKTPISVHLIINNPVTRTNYFNDFTHTNGGPEIICVPSEKTFSIHAEAPGYIFFSGQFSPAQTEMTIALEPIKLGKMVSLANIFFESNSDSILPSSDSEIVVLARFLKSNPQIRVEIQGHTDAVGKKDANQKLSEKRAKSLFLKLRQLDVPFNQIEFKGYGDSQPVSDNGTELGRSQNRRIAIKIVRINP